MLGFDRGWRTAVIASLLILYNAGWFVITRAVGDMRDNEERTGWSRVRSVLRHPQVHDGTLRRRDPRLMELGLFLFTDFVYLPA